MRPFNKKFPLILREVAAMGIRISHASLGPARVRRYAQEHVDNLTLDME